MSLTLYFHPLASFCHKVLIALYEQGIEFEGKIVDFGNPGESANFLELWPVGKIPVLRDEQRNRTIPETTIIIEYLDRHYAGQRRMLPTNPEQALEARLWDRFFDQYVSVPMQKIVTDRIRAEGEHDPKGVADARTMLANAYDMLERRCADRAWAIGEVFTIVDCSAAPALFYADTVRPFIETHPQLAAYFDRLVAHPSVRRTIAEARPFFHMYPYREALRQRFVSDQ
jgi:glutathione S-transferase